MFPKITPKTKERVKYSYNLDYNNNYIYNKNIVKKKSVRKREGKREKFLIEFASEIDLYSDGSKYPEWVFEYREELLLKLSPNLMKICSKLKDSGYDFKIKYPVLIDGKYKFADIYIPRKRTVIVMLSYYKEGYKPIWSTSDKSSFFKDRFHVIECYEFEDDIISKLECIR